MGTLNPDAIVFGNENDFFGGTSDPDEVLGRGGNDTLLGAGEDDTLRGGRDDDRIFGQRGDDVLKGGDGDDLMAGGQGDDQLNGVEGDDTLGGGQGDDTLKGGDGDDRLLGGLGDDLVFGGEGIDTFVVHSLPSETTITFGTDNRGNFVRVEGPEGVDMVYEVEFIKFGDQSTIPVCFYPGTRIATPSGDVAVETLTAGDVVATADGRTATVRWMGRQTVSTRFGDPMRTLPIRIQAGALGENLPARDLLISPAHALMIDGVLVHAAALVNGTTVTREANVPEVFTYWHIETEGHQLVLAEGAPAETFVDNVDRENFDNWAEYVAIVGEGAQVAEMNAPRAKSHRQVPASIRSRIAARAAAVVGKAALAA